MPKTGPTPDDWENKLRQYAATFTTDELPEAQETPPMIPVPRADFFRTCYINDTLKRRAFILGALVSVFGIILKIDATFKICKKFAGRNKHIAANCTSITNEKSQFVKSVFTVSEDEISLQKMAEELMDRYEKAGMPPPKVLYVDSKCCTKCNLNCRNSRNSFYKRLFHKWPDLEITLGHTL